MPLPQIPRDPLHAIPVPGFFAKVGETFGLSRPATVGIFVASAVALVAAVVFSILSAPKHTITITSGPEGSTFYSSAVKYSKILAKQGVKVRILTSHGSLENLQRLNDPRSNVDVGFVQDGLTEVETTKLNSLGSISYQPLLVFYRGAPVDTLAAFAGKRIAIGAEGSGTRNLAIALLAANGIKPDEASAPVGTISTTPAPRIAAGAVPSTPAPATTLLGWEAQEAYQSLLAGKADAIFLMGEDATTGIMHDLLHSPDVHLLSFSQAEAYSRRFSWLSQLKLPRGSIDLGKNIPAEDVNLVGPTIELVARKDLHPALSDLLLEAAQEVHGKATLLQRKGEFPAPMEHDFQVSDDAKRFYRSGKSFFYHYLPFWLASLTSRIVVVFIPTVVILIPVLRSIPQIYRWRIQSQVYRWYRALLALEKELAGNPGAEERAEMLVRLDEIEKAVNRMKVPAFFADQFYVLRGHIDFVRQLVNRQAHHEPGHGD